VTSWPARWPWSGHAPRPPTAPTSPEQLGYDLAGAGWTIVSTGGFGIDTAALRGALTGGGTTAAVLPVGVDRPYPHANTNLFEQVARHGVLVSP
jgi:DNA processing protein